MGIIRTLQFVGTLIVAGPVALIGVFLALQGQYQLAAVFLGVALGFVVVSEYLYLQFVDRTVGRLKRLTHIRGRSNE